MKQRLLVFFQLLPAILSMLILGAHFLRYANMIEVAVCAALPLLLFIRRRFVVWVFQFALLAAAVIWTDTVWNLVEMRQQLGAAWMRMAFILGGVIVFTLASAALFFTKTLRSRYNMAKPAEK